MPPDHIDTDYSAYVDPNESSPDTRRALVVIKGSDASFRPTENQRAMVEKFAGYDMKFKEICQLVINPATGKPIDAATLRRCFHDELARGGPLMKATLAGKIFETAYGHPAEFDESGQPVRAEAAPNPRLLEYLGQSKLNWKKTVVVENNDVSPEAANALGQEIKQMFAEALEKSQQIMGNGVGMVIEQEPEDKNGE